jgi:ABC-2 type transport system permease protein
VEGDYNLAFDRTLLIIRKEILQLARNRRVLVIALFMPAIMMTAIGLAFSGEVKQISTVIVNEDGGSVSWQLVWALQQCETFKITYYAYDLAQAESLIRDGFAKAAILIPQTFEKNLREGGAQIYVLVDGSEPVSAGEATSAAFAVAQAFSPKVAVNVNNIVLFNPALRYIDFLAPAVLSFILQIIPVVLMAISISGEKERGTIEQLIVTPIGGFDILFGKMLVYMMIGAFDAFLMMAVAVYLFKLVIKGSVFLIAVFVLMFLSASLSIGILVSVLSKTQLQATQTILPILMPTVFLSGVFYPIEAMPDFIRPISYFIPLTYMVHALRSLMVKGVGFSVVALDLVALTFYALAIMALAVVAFRKRLE